MMDLLICMSMTPRSQGILLQNVKTCSWIAWRIVGAFAKPARLSADASRAPPTTLSRSECRQQKESQTNLDTA